MPRGGSDTLDSMALSCGPVPGSYVRALSSADPGVQESADQVQRQIEAMAAGILVDLDPKVRSDIMAVLGHVWYSTLVAWANDRIDFDAVIAELDRAVRVLVEPHQRTVPA